MTRSRGAISKTMLDCNYPHQVMLKERCKISTTDGEIQRLSSRLGAYALGHHFHFAEEHADYSVYCFPTFDAGQTFLNINGGRLSPDDRKKRNWRPRRVLPPRTSVK